mgnify:CR=1 FL=1
MPFLLQIGYQNMVVPDSVNVQTILKELKKGKFVQYDHSVKGKYLYIESEIKLEKLSVEVIGEDQIIQQPKPKQIPEKSSKECNGADYFRRENE